MHILVIYVPKKNVEPNLSNVFVMVEQLSDVMMLLC